MAPWGREELGGGALEEGSEGVGGRGVCLWWGGGVQRVGVRVGVDGKCSFSCIPIQFHQHLVLLFCYWVCFFRVFFFFFLFLFFFSLSSGLQLIELQIL